MQQDRKSRGHNIQCLFAAVCQLEPALLTVKEIRAQAQAVYRKAIAGKSRSTFWKVLCVWLCLVNWLKHAMFLFLPSFSKLWFMLSGNYDQRCPAHPRTKNPDPSISTSMCLCVCACWKGQIWRVTGPVWLGGTPALVCERDQSFLHRSS